MSESNRNATTLRCKDGREYHLTITKTPDTANCDYQYEASMVSIGAPDFIPSKSYDDLIIHLGDGVRYNTFIRRAEPIDKARWRLFGTLTGAPLKDLTLCR